MKLAYRDNRVTKAHKVHKVKRGILVQMVLRDQQVLGVSKVCRELLERLHLQD